MNSHIPNKEGYTPEFPLNKKVLPAKALGLRRNLVVGVVSSVTLLVAIIVISAFSPNEKRKALPIVKNDKGYPSELVASLPADYSKMPRLAPTKAASQKADMHDKLRQEIAPIMEDSEADKIMREYEVMKLKRKLKARDADPSFPNIDFRRTMQAAGGQEMERNAYSETAALKGLGATGNVRDDANRQDDKVSFLQDTRSDKTSLRSALKRPASPYSLLAGTVVPGVLLTGINSDLPGAISAQVSQNIYDTAQGDFLLIPQGTKVIGEYDSRIAHGQERVLIVWTRLIFPNGNSINLEGMPGVDLSGYAGLTDRVNNHYGKLLAGVVFGSVIGAGAQVAQGSNNAVDPSFGQLALEGTAQNINDAGQQITRKNLNIQPTLEISPGFRFSVFVTRDMILQPYK